MQVLRRGNYLSVLGPRAESCDEIFIAGCIDISSLRMFQSLPVCACGVLVINTEHLLIYIDLFKNFRCESESLVKVKSW